MRTTTIFIGLTLVAVLALASCSGGAAGSENMDKDMPATEMTPKETMTGEDMMEQETPAAETMMDKEIPATGSTMDGETEGEMMAAPDWFSLPLTDVASGETFTIGDLKGKVVLVETMAQWCSNCLQQQKEVKKLHDLLGERDDFISLGLDIDPNENADTLKAYIERNGFDWVYAVATPEVSREIGNLYGSQYLNPPSTPMLIVDSHGETHMLPFGIKSAEELKMALEAFLMDKGM